MAPEDLVIDIPSDDITINPNDGAAPAANVVAEPAKDTPAVVDEAAPEHVIDSIKKDLEQALRRSEEKSREIEEAKRQATEERTARTKLESDLANTTDKAFRAHWQAVTSEQQQIVNGIQSRKSEMLAAKSAYKQALDAGNSDAAADANERMASIAAELLALENGKAGAEQAVKEAESYFRAKQAVPKTVPKPETPRQPTPDEWIGQVRNAFGGKPADWLEKNRQFVTDPKLNQKLLKLADYYREVEGKPLDSQDFIQTLNSKLLGEPMAEEEAKPAPVAAGVKKSAIASAPVSRGGDYFSSRNLNAGKIKLPSDLAKFCDESNLNKTTYAQSLVQLIKEGKLPKEYLDEGYNRSI